MPAFALFAAVVAGNMQPLHRAEPIESPGSWLSTADYPADALRRGVQGTVGFRLTVDESGRPSDCAIEGSSGDAALDQATCALVLARARFRPARDVNDVAVPDSFASRIRWVADSNPFLIGDEPVRIVNYLTAEPDGLVTCFISLNDGPPPSGVGFGCGIDYDVTMVLHFASRFRGRTVQLLDNIVYMPGPASAPPEGRERLGDLYFRQEVHLDVEPDGTVSECRILHRTRGEADGPTPPNVCGYYRDMGAYMFAPRHGSIGTRPIRVTHDYYIRLRDYGGSKP